MKAETSAVLQKVIDALDIEISTIQSENLPNRINLKNGKLIKKFEKSFIYSFELDDIFNVPENTVIEINHQNITYKGVILLYNNLELTISFDTELPADSLVQLILIFNRTYYLEKLKSGLERVLEKQILSNEDIVLKSFGSINVNPGKDTNVPVQDTGICLDEYQQECIQHCLGSEVSYVWGMPGTGKSVVIAHLIDILAKNHESILLLTNSNNAVDTAIEKYFNFFKGKSHEIANGDILRCGIILKDEIRDFVNEAGLIERKRKPRVDNINSKHEQVKSIVDEIKHLQSELKEREMVKSDKEQLKNLDGKLVLLKDELKSCINGIKEVEQSIQDLNSQVNLKKEDLKLSESLSSVSRMMKGVSSPEKIKSSITGIEEEIKTAKKQKTEKEELKLSYEKKITETEVEIGNIKETINAFASKGNLDQPADIIKVTNRINELTAQQKHILYEISKFNNEIQEIDKITVNETKIIASPISHFITSPELNSKSYDVIIIDEAAEMKFPEILFASCFAKKKIIYAGDFLVQQPVVFAEDNDQAALWIKRDIFKTIGIGDRDDKKVVLDPRVVTLRKQRKMPEAVAEILNNSLYEKRIISAISADNLIPGDRPVSLFDTSNYTSYSTISEDLNGRINVFNIMLCISLAQKYYNLKGISSIGIVTLYNEQASLITKLVKELNLTDKVYSNVIYNFDGADRDVIILDIPEGANTKGCSLGKVLTDDKLSYLYGSVISRTKKKINVVINRKYLLNYVAALNDTIIKVLGTITKSTSDDFEVVEPVTVIPELQSVDENSDDFKNKKIMHLSKDVFTNILNSEFSKEIKELIIYSPLINKNEAEKLDGIFKSLREKECNIAVVTLPLKDQDLNIHDLVNSWLNMGINFKFVDNLIEKLIVIDQKTVYYGNVGILAQNDEKATIFRINGQEIVRELHKIYASNLFTTQQRAAKVQKEISEDLPF